MNKEYIKDLENENASLKKQVKNLRDSGGKEDEKKLGHELAKYHAIFNLSPEAIVFLDKKGKVLDVNNKIFEWLEYKRSEVIGKNLINLPYLPARSKLKVLKNFGKRIGGMEVEPYVVEFLTKSGKTLFGRIRASVIKDEENGTTVGSLVLIDNITETILAQQEKEKIEKKFRLLTETADAMIYIISKDGFEYINPYGEELLGYTANELYGKNFLEFTTPEYRQEAIDKAQGLISGKEEAIQLEGVIRNRHGKDYWVVSNAAHLEYEGKPAFIGVSFDITKQKAAEERIKQYSERLAVLNNEKDKFFSIIAHDLKSPFSALLGYSDMLIEDLEDLEPDEIKEYSENINHVAKSVSDLLENLLEWSRIQTGRIEIENHYFDFCNITGRVYDLYRNTVKTKEVSLDIDLEDQCKVFADENIIFTVLRNLVSNAVKFTPPGGKISITSRKKGEFMVTEVSDTGVGISEKDIAKLFRIDISHTTIGTGAEKGTGLGLILCKELIQKIGGDISVSSTPGKGTVFTFTTPLTEKKV